MGVIPVFLEKISICSEVKYIGKKLLITYKAVIRKIAVKITFEQICLFSCLFFIFLSQCRHIIVSLGYLLRKANTKIGSKIGK